AATPQTFDTIVATNLVVFFAGIEGQLGLDLLALFQGLAGRFAGGDHQESDAAHAQLVIRVVGTNGEDVLDDLQDRLRDEGSAVGALLDAPAEQTVEGLGVDAP